MMQMRAPAKLNLALVVGPVRPDGKHEVATILQAIDLCDDIELAPAEALNVEGFPADTIVQDALARLADAAGVPPGWCVRIQKRIPVAAGLGGGSSNAAAALALANAALPMPLPADELHSLASRVGADVPFFLHAGTQLGMGDGSDLSPVDLPTDYVAVLVLSEGARKESTASIYRRFDEADGADGFEERRSHLLNSLEDVTEPRDLAKLPGNDLASSPLARELQALGAFRADVTGAGPTLYGLFDDVRSAERAASLLAERGRSWVVRPVQQR